MNNANTKSSFALPTGARRYGPGIACYAVDSEGRRYLQTLSGCWMPLLSDSTRPGRAHLLARVEAAKAKAKKNLKLS